MIRKLIPLGLALIGLVAGMGLGFVLRTAPEAAAATEDAVTAHVEPSSHSAKVPDYVKLNNQFIVPILDDGRVVSMVIMSLSLEVETGATEEVYAREPKLRDACLQVMFDHANAGGFRGSFTDAANLLQLRKALLEAAKSNLGDIVTDVLIVDIVRQDN